MDSIEIRTIINRTGAFVTACLLIACGDAIAQQHAPSAKKLDWGKSLKAEPLLQTEPVHYPTQAQLLPEEESDELSNGNELGDLDKLLELSENDIGSLSQVQVARPSVAPSLDTVVSTVERKESTVGRTPAAVFVITREMIRRSGARHVPEVLRMAPGVQVAQIDANKWAVSIRGFNGRFANKLLVQIDGRSVYNPLFGGVFWDAQGILLEDVERIEVVRGPGGTVWGANAVNGVVNIVTRKAADTHGTFAEAGGGNLERSFGAFRQGGNVGKDADMRVFGQWSERGAFSSPLDHDDWQNGRFGARLDWKTSPEDSHTIQGDFYQGSSGTLSVFPTATVPYAALTKYNERINGGNLVYRWNHKLSDDSDWQIQTYYEQTQRRFVPTGSYYERHTLDLDFQHRFRWNENNEFIWGAGYRTNMDEIRPQPYFLSAAHQKDQYGVVNAFAQDTITLHEDYLSLTLGTKLLHNDFTGGEVQPSARLLWTPTDRVSSWLAASRAVRTSTRLTHDGRIVLPGGPVGPYPVVFPVLTGSSQLESEDVFALEAGFRYQPTARFSWDLAGFWNRYEDLVGIGPSGGITSGPEGFVAIMPFVNSGSAQTYGVEFASNFQVNDNWSLQGNYTFLKLNFDGAVSASGGDAPLNQFYLQSSHQLSKQVELDLIWRYIDSLSNQSVSGYSSFNVRVGWHPKETVEVYVMGTNLFSSPHSEYGNDPFAGTQSTKVPQGVFGGVALRF